MNLFKGFSADDLRLNCKLAETRIEQLKNKKMNGLKRQRDEIVKLLGDKKQEELARIRTEHMVREDFNIEVLQIIALHCALLKERVKLLDSSPTIPHDMRQCITTLVYAADRIDDVPELTKIRSNLMLKYKKELSGWLASEEKTRENVNERVFERLSPKPPNARIVLGYMVHIAKENNLDWEPSENPDFGSVSHAAPAPTGVSVAPGEGSGIRTPYYVTDGSISSTAASKGSLLDPVIKPGGGPPKSGGGGGSLAPGGVVPSLFDTPVSATTKPGGGGAGGGGGGKSPPAKVATTVPQADFAVLSEETSGRHNLFPVAAPVTANASAVPDYDELQARFEALRRGD